MPKMKSNRGATKRFRTTGTGKIVRAHASKSHLLTGKSTKRMRVLRGRTLVDKADVKRIRVLPRTSNNRTSREPRTAVERWLGFRMPIVGIQ